MSDIIVAAPNRAPGTTPTQPTGALLLSLLRMTQLKLRLWMTLSPIGSQLQRSNGCKKAVANRNANESNAMPPLMVCRCKPLELVTLVAANVC